ncbi:protein disulfide oxidoreductase [Thiorhodospira sibirica]|uniref:protein disulfide oxidoreductase n=1 Tax=Thiorhodospira sibirica TaxID=154347 RepID=UPI00022C2DF5|nr:protein disulfide oxidoreductase [Thiorhodospira sibirica]
MAPSDNDPKAVKKPRRWWRYALELLLILALFWAFKSWLERDMLSGPAPPLHGTLVNGTAFNLEDYRGEAVLVYFWASWCGVCRVAQNGIQAVAADWPVITIAMQSGDVYRVMAYLREHELDFPVLLDEHGELAAQFGVSAVPASFIIDPHGNIRYRERGYTSSLGLRARLWLAQWR